MIDNRFYNIKENITMYDVCDRLGLEVPAKSSAKKIIKSLAALDKATNDDITFFHNIKYKSQLEKTNAYACVIKQEYAQFLPKKVTAIIVKEPYYSLAILLRVFYEQKLVAPCDINDQNTYISPTAIISKKAIIEEGCHIADGAVIYDDCIIRKNTYIGANAVIHRGVEIGEISRIESNVTICCAIIGAKSYIKTGSRIGQPGFGFHIGSAGPVDILQIGRVIIGRDVQIGANCTIDRGSMEDTVIGNMVRIDDMVHVAHNVHIGDNCIIAAQCGIAGSTTLGKGCILGGQVGISGHLKIGNHVVIAAKSGVMSDVEDDKKIGGIPATGISMWHRQTITLRKLIQPKK